MQTAAEEVRAHWVHLRGGGLFLSSADARRLVGWLEEGRTVGELLEAMERLASARAARPSRLPFTLGGVSRHLAKVPRAVTPSAGSLAPLVAALRARGERDLLGLADGLEGLSAIALDAEALFRGATSAIRAWVEASLAALPPAAAEAARAAVRAELMALYGPLWDSLEESEASLRVEEWVRARLRARYPELGGERILKYCQGGTP